MKTAPQTAHTPLPWSIVQAVGIGGLPEKALHLRTEEGVTIATLKATHRHLHVSEAEMRANADFIMSAVSSHAELLAALIDAKNRFSALALDAHASENTIRAVASKGAQKIRDAIARATQ